MIAVEELLSELTREDINEQMLPPGFRFHPTDEELITFYLASKVFNGGFCGVEIAEVDLNRCEPWELPDMAKMGEREWYFFSLRDRKYPTGLRTNRATGAGYWKATGKDREVHGASTRALLGMKKTLVFYRGRAPRGEKTKWVMHEYRLDGDFSYRHKCKEEWVICRIFHKNGEKKNTLLQGQCYRLEASSSLMSGSLPPLLEAPMTALECQSKAINSAEAKGLRNSFLDEHREIDLKTQLISQPQILAMNGFQPPFVPAPIDSTSGATTNENVDTSTSNNPSPSMLVKSLLSYGEYCTLKEPLPFINPKLCKSEGNFSHFQLEDANLGWLDKIYTNPYQHPLHFEMNNNLLGLPETAVAEATVHEMSTSQLPLTGPGFRRY